MILQGEAANITFDLWVPSSAQSLPYYVHTCAVAVIIAPKPLWNTSSLRADCHLEIPLSYGHFPPQFNTTSTPVVLSTAPASTRASTGSSINISVGLVIALVVVGAVLFTVVCWQFSRFILHCLFLTGGIHFCASLAGVAINCANQGVPATARPSVRSINIKRPCSR